MTEPRPIPTDIGDMISYDAETGVLTWARDTKSHGRTGDVCGTPDGRGYIKLKCKGRVYRAHRIAWFLGTGEQPPDILDHINGNGSDNRLCNLRPATISENRANSKRFRNNTSGFCGVQRTGSGKWFASVSRDRKRYYLGTFETREQAAAAYAAAAKQLYGEYVRAAA